MEEMRDETKEKITLKDKWITRVSFLVIILAIFYFEKSKNEVSIQLGMLAVIFIFVFVLVSQCEKGTKLKYPERDLSKSYSKMNKILVLLMPVGVLFYFFGEIDIVYKMVFIIISLLLLTELTRCGSVISRHGEEDRDRFVALMGSNLLMGILSLVSLIGMLILNPNCYGYTGEVKKTLIIITLIAIFTVMGIIALLKEKV